MSDFRWMTCGGLLVDGSGDIATTPAGSLENIQSMASSRVKAALNGWKLYPIGADLDSFLGNPTDPELQIGIERQVQATLTDNFLPASAVTVKTVAYGGQIFLMVYLSQSLILQTTISTQSGATA